MSEQEPVLSRVFSMEIARVTEAAAVAASRLTGCGDEKAADQAAVDAMRTALNKLDIEGTIVIGEGERDEAPMLYIGEKVGTGKGPALDIALDPLEGTTITAKSMPNALAVIAFAEKGNLLNAPDVYMEKIAIGGGFEPGLVDLDRDPEENIRLLAAAKGVAVEEITACVLDRPRHADIIASIRKAGARIQLIPDGDVAGVIATTEKGTGIDIYIGTGGAPEGVLAAAALRAIGGQMQGRLVFANDEQRQRAREMGVTDPDHKYTLEEMAAGDVIFAATGVTDGSMLDGIHRAADGSVTTHTVVMRSRTGTVRWVKARHDSEDKFRG